MPRAPKAVTVPERESVTTFNKPNLLFMVGSRNKEPSCFNGKIGVVTWRVTVERIEEPIEVIHERLQRLWEKCVNYHHWDALLAEAKRHGYAFKGERGSKAEKMARECR